MFWTVYLLEGFLGSFMSKQPLTLSRAVFKSLSVSCRNASSGRVEGNVRLSLCILPSFCFNLASLRLCLFMMKPVVNTEPSSKRYGKQRCALLILHETLLICHWEERELLVLSVFLVWLHQIAATFTRLSAKQCYMTSVNCIQGHCFASHDEVQTNNSNFNILRGVNLQKNLVNLIKKRTVQVCLCMLFLGHNYNKEQHMDAFSDLTLLSTGSFVSAFHNYYKPLLKNVYIL